MKNYLLLSSVAIALIACTKDKNPDPIPQYDVPATYTFENVEYTDATKAVCMNVAFGAYLAKATSRQLTQDSVNNLWNNTNSAFISDFASNLPYTPDQLNGFNTIKLSAVTADPNTIKAFADAAVLVSKSIGQTASQGVPGKLGSRIIDAKGLEPNQLVVKGLMGHFQLKQVSDHLDKATTADNSTVNAGKGTDMQHEWDLAFGYVGIPKDYDTTIIYNKTDVNRPLAVGGYFAERAKPIGAGGVIFGAFLKGRAAIGAKDYAVRDAAIATIKEYLEKTLAISAYTYLNLSKTRGSDNASRFHDYSEAHGFVLALNYRAANSKLTSTNYQKLKDILKMDFWELQKTENAAKVDDAINVLKTTYNFN